MSSILQLHLSFSKSVSLSTTTTTCPLFPQASPKTSSPSRTGTLIRMGGGPRTFPGGVSKWQWKRMQANKQKQLLKARLTRERQIYEMRKRAELKAAVADLERPWEVVEKPPNLFSVNADEQVKVLADRFQRPGGFDMWSDRDGPQIFESVDGLPSARFFPKGVVHSVKPYGKISGFDDSENISKLSDRIDEPKKNTPNEGNGRFHRNGKRISRSLRRKDNSSSRQVGLDIKPREELNSRHSDGVGRSSERNKGEEKSKKSGYRVHDMRLQQDGTYGS